MKYCRYCGIQGSMKISVFIADQMTGIIQNVNTATMKKTLF